MKILTFDEATAYMRDWKINHNLSRDKHIADWSLHVARAPNDSQLKVAQSMLQFWTNMWKFTDL